MYAVGTVFIISLCSTPVATAASVAPKAPDIIKHPVFHIVEEPGMVAHMADCEIPTEKYYDALAADMAARHPLAETWVLEHLASLEPFLDTSIVAGFSYGVSLKQRFV